jgi:hypothetical protein
VIWRKLDIELCCRRERRGRRSAAIGGWRLSWPDDDVETVGLRGAAPFEPRRCSAFCDMGPLEVVPEGRVRLVARVVGDIEDDEMGAEGRFGLKRRPDVVLNHHVRAKEVEADESDVMTGDLHLNWRINVDVQLPRLGHLDRGQLFRSRPSGANHSNRKIALSGEKWRRRESNPRPRPHRTELLQV